MLPIQAVTTEAQRPTIWKHAEVVRKSSRLLKTTGEVKQAAGRQADSNDWSNADTISFVQLNQRTLKMHESDAAE